MMTYIPKPENLLNPILIAESAFWGQTWTVNREMPLIIWVSLQINRTKETTQNSRFNEVAVEISKFD